MESPFSEIENKIEKMIENPEMATPQALTELRDTVSELRAYFEDDEETMVDDEMDMEEDENEKPSLMITIGKAARGGKKMMRSLLLGVGLIFAATLSYAAMDRPDLPATNSNVIQGPFNSTNTFATTSAQSAIVSSYSVILHSIVVNSSGTSSWLEVFDTKVATSTSGIRKIAKINTATQGTYAYDIHLSSGLGVNNWSNTASVADVTINYKQR